MKEVAKKDSTELANIQDELYKQMEEFKSTISTPTKPMIRVQGKTFVFPDGHSEDQFDGVILTYVDMNNYYGNVPYDSQNPTPPICFAIGRGANNLIPSNNSSDKQSDNCQVCPNNQWKSAGKGKACKNTKLLAILPPDAGEETPIMFLRLSPTALNPFDAFVGRVINQHNTAPIGVVATFALDPGETFPKIIVGNPRPNEKLAIMFPRIEEAEDLLRVEPNTTDVEIN